MIGLKKDFDKEFHKVQKSMLAHAEQLAAVNGTELDYTEGSIGVLDKMFVGIAHEFEQAGVSKDEIESNESAQGIAEAVGCYIVECIERQYGKGRWLQNSDGYGFEINSGAVIYPMTWTMKKILDPSEYSLADAYAKWVKA
jgi:hypothetical protein